MSVEVMIPETERPSVVPSIQSVINNSPFGRLDERDPITVHTRMPSDYALFIALTVAQSGGVLTINEAELIRKLEIIELSEALEQTLRDLRDQLTNT